MLNNNCAVDLADDAQVRTPLAARIADELRSQHPNWTNEHIHSEAKAQAIAQLQGKNQFQEGILC